MSKLGNIVVTVWAAVVGAAVWLFTMAVMARCLAPTGPLAQPPAIVWMVASIFALHAFWYVRDLPTEAR